MHAEYVPITYLASPLANRKVTALERNTHRDKARSVAREGRKRLGLTQTQVGAIADLSQGEISRIESGKVDPPVWWIMYLLHVFPDLITGEADEVGQLRSAAHLYVDSLDAASLRRVLSVK